MDDATETTTTPTRQQRLLTELDNAISQQNSIRDTDANNEDTSEAGRRRPSTSSRTLQDSRDGQEHEKVPVEEELTRQETDEEGNSEYVTGIKLWAVVSCVTLSCFLLLLDISIIGTAIPRITSDFHSLPDVGWYGGAYQLANAALQPLTGKFFTHFNTKWTYLIFFFVFELGSLLCGVATSSPMFIAGRTIAGLGGSGLMNGGITMIAGIVPLKNRPTYTGILMGISQLGLICGPLIGGALTEYATWRWCFYMNLPIGGLVALLLVFTHVPNLTVKPPFSLATLRQLLPELDLFGFILFAPTAIMFLMALQFGGNDYAWNSSVVIGLFCGAGATAICFVWWERRMGERAMIPGSVLRQRIVYCSIIATWFLMSTVVVAGTYLPIYFQGVKGLSPTMSGVYSLPSILSQLLFVMTSGALVSRLGYYLPWTVFAGVMTAIGNGLTSTFSPSTDTGKIIGYQIAMGAGRGAGMQMALIACQNALSAEQLPVSMALIIFSQNFSGAVMLVVATTIFTQSLHSDIPVLAPSVSPEEASDAGASASSLSALVPPGSPDADGLLLAYSNAFDRVYYLMAACGVVVFLAAFGTGWKDIRKKKKKGSEQAHV